jgi:hypothetical protein
VQRYERWRGEQYSVRSVSGSMTVKDYRCPGCDQLLRAGQPHVVAWPAREPDASSRRHWHTPCWAAREHRTPTSR